MFFKSKISTLTVCAFLLISVFAGCNIRNNTTQSTSADVTKVQETTASQTEQVDNSAENEINIPIESTTPNTQQFADVYEEYTEALVAKTPVLISEFNSEIGNSAENNNPEALLENKKQKLTDIFYEGLAGFVDVVGDTGADADEYEFWHNRLEEVYNAQIDELLSSCTVQNGIEYGEDMDY